jgi:hypothetical protein
MCHEPLPNALHDFLTCCTLITPLSYTYNDSNSAAQGFPVCVDFSDLLQYSQNPPSARVPGHLNCTCALKFTFNNIPSHTSLKSGHVWDCQRKFCTFVLCTQCMLRTSSMYFFFTYPNLRIPEDDAAGLYLQWLFYKTISFFHFLT